MHQQRSTSFLFNSYTDEAGCKGNSCSAALNKWLKHHVPDAVIHSFRHSFRDRLRNAGVQSEMIDQLGGWSKQSVGQGYGHGYGLASLTNAMLYLTEEPRIQSTGLFGDGITSSTDEPTRTSSKYATKLADI